MCVRAQDCCLAAWGFLLSVMPTKAAPGHNWSWVPGSNALQDGRLVDIDGQVLRSGEDDGLSVGAEA